MSNQGNRRSLCSVWGVCRAVSIDWYGRALKTLHTHTVTPVLLLSILILRFLGYVQSQDTGGPTAAFKIVQALESD